MARNHWLAVGMLLSGLAVNVANLQSWHDAYTPTGVAAFLLTVGSVLTALFSEKVQ